MALWQDDPRPHLPALGPCLWLSRVVTKKPGPRTGQGRHSPPRTACSWVAAGACSHLSEPQFLICLVEEKTTPTSSSRVAGQRR